MTRIIKLMAIGLCLLDVAILTLLSAYSFDLNDHMYAAAALADGALYRDVHFVQAPVTFYFLKAQAALLPDGFVYPGLRAISLLLVLGALFVGAFACIDRWPSRCLFLAFAGANIYFLYPGFEIGSYSLPLLLLALATASLWKIRQRGFAIAAAALLIGLAASAKLNHVLFFLPLAAFLLTQKRTGESLLDWMRGAVLPFAIGGLAGSLPVIIAFLQAPAAFAVNALIFHSRFSLRTINLGAFASFMQISNLFTDWAAAGGAVLLALGIYAAFFDRNQDGRSRNILRFAIFSGLAGLIAAVSPGISYVQYWAPITFFAALAAARFFDHSRANLRLIGLLALLPFLTVGVRELRSQLSNNLKASSTPKAAIVMTINRQLRDFSRHTNESPQCDRRLFSLTGAFTVDSGFPVSRYMEGGTFWSWVSGQVSQTYIADKRYHLDEYLIFPERWVRDQRLNFLLTGFYPGHTEEDVDRYAAERGFKVVQLPVWGGLTLKFSFNPECLKAT